MISKLTRGGCDKILNGLKLNIVTAVAIECDVWEGENVVSPYSRLYYVKNGSGKLIVDDKTYYLEPNHIYLIPVGKRISFHSNGYLEKIYVHFNITRPDGYDFLRDFDYVGIIECSKEYIDNIYKFFKSTYISDKFQFDASLHSDIATMIDKYGITLRKPIEYSSAVFAAMNFIAENLNIKIKISDIAKKISVSESSLSKKFREELGISVSEYIDQMVFYKVQIDLLESDKSIDDIAREYGFCDRFYFSSRFKKLYYETPSKYRTRAKISIENTK